MQQLREAYAQQGLPIHPKKTVQQETHAEVQGAWINGEQGTMSAKPSKILKYVRLALEVVAHGAASQKEVQVVGGGLVYVQAATVGGPESYLERHCGTGGSPKK